MRSGQPTSLEEAERRLLGGFLSFDFPGVLELREQVPHLLAKKGCDCGCGTIELVSAGTELPRSSAPNPVPVHAAIAGPDGDEVGGLILFVRHGLLQSLEVYSTWDPLPLPALEQVTWWP